MQLKTISGKVLRPVKKLMTSLEDQRLWRQYLASPQSMLPKNIPPDTSLSKTETLLLIKPWYHDFEALGFSVPQKSGFYKANQESKQGPLFKLIDRAISLCREQGTSTKGVELFTADGFYINYAVQRGAEKMHGIDVDKYYLAKAGLITKLLGNQDKISFERCDVFEVSGTYDFCICAGGLYHLVDPRGLLSLLREKISTALVVQTVYSLANTSKDYFVSSEAAEELNWPWPGQGSRFSYSYLLQMVSDAGWSVIDSMTNELQGNSSLEDKGSAYLLCVPRENYSA